MLGNFRSCEPCGLRSASLPNYAGISLQIQNQICRSCKEEYENVCCKLYKTKKGYSPCEIFEQLNQLKKKGVPAIGRHIYSDKELHKDEIINPCSYCSSYDMSCSKGMC